MAVRFCTLTLLRRLIRYAGVITRVNGVATGALEDAAQLLAQNKIPHEPRDIAKSF
jgi:hypothetical protein